MAKLKPVPAAPVEVPVVKKKSKKLLLIGVAVLILGAAAGGGWFWLHQQPVESKAEEKKAPVFATLEPFTVNLLQEAGDHYLQVGVVYQVDSDKTVDAMKTYMPVIRNRILLLLSGKHPSELAQVDGKQKLVAELVLVARESLPEGKTPEHGIEGAFLSAFVIQ
jgi:flagellar FliL protein